MLTILMMSIVLATLWLFLRGRRQDPSVTAALADLERKLHLLVDHLQKHHPQDPRTLRLTYGWDGRLTEHKTQGAGATFDKKSIALCVRDSSGRLQDPMTAFFVGTHEASHVCSVSQGHTAEFWSNFRFLLKEAVAAGLYRYQDFDGKHETYCGTSIASSPLTECLRDGSCA